MVKNDGNKIAIGPNKLIGTRYEMVEISKLHFYPNNPRISSVVMKYDKKDLTDEFIYKKMEEGQRDAVNTLYQEVKKDGNINEPLIVYENKVLEGNTRLWVVKTLYSETNLEKWQYAPCRIVEGDLDTKEIDYILCNAHIRKKKDWVPFEQACYFHRMKEEEGRTTQEISELTGVGSNRINDYIRTFKEMKARDADKDQFSHYYEAIKETEVKKAEKEGIRVLDVIERGLKKGEIKDAKHVRKLKNILKDPVATNKLVSGQATIYRAETIAKTRDPKLDDDFLNNLSETTVMIKNVEPDKLKSIQNNPRKKKIVLDFIEAVNKVFTDFNGK